MFRRCEVGVRRGVVAKQQGAALLDPVGPRSLDRETHVERPTVLLNRRFSEWRNRTVLTQLSKCLGAGQSRSLQVN